MNYIKYGLYKFHGDSEKYGKDGLFMSGNAEQMIALFGNELSADSLTFVVNSRALQGDGTGYAFLLDINERPIQTIDGKYLVARNVFPDYRDFKAGAQLDLYNNPDGQIIGRFYVEDVTQVSRKTVKFTCTDCVGVLSKMEEYGGGIWEQSDNKTAGQIISEIMAGSGIVYTVMPDVASVQCIGRLPRDNRRVDLGKLLVATGATLTENQGTVVIKYLGASTPSSVPSSRVYLEGGSVSYMHPATEVQVVEHGFYDLATDEVVTLFDNTDEQVTAQNQLVVFNNPCHDLTTTGSITISESNANYAVISGIGTLEGKEYTHTTRVITRSTGVVAAENVVRLENNELVGVHNSANVAKRMVNRYKLPMSISYEQLDPNGLLMAGTPVDVTDPFGTARTGWIYKKSFPIGNKTKAKMDVLVDFVTGPYGSTYTDYAVFRAEDITGAGRLNIPAAMQGKEALVVLIGGAGGGQAGYNGADGEAPSGLKNFEAMAQGMGGAGGNGGATGERPKVLSFQEVALPSYYDGAAIGVGGAGGASNGALGSAGGATTLGGLSSADGSTPIDDVVNFLDGTVYCALNATGERGADGGIGAGRGSGHDGESTNGANHICEDGTTNYGGAYKNALSYTYKQGSNSRRYRDIGGGGGGGAAHGADGGAAYGPYDLASENIDPSIHGGAGADAVAPAQAPETQAGRGGHGGGGGGGAAKCRYHTDGSSVFTYGFNVGGAGGAGSAGGEGGDGLILIYYNA